MKYCTTRDRFANEHMNDYIFELGERYEDMIEKTVLLYNDQEIIVCK